MGPAAARSSVHIRAPDYGKIQGMAKKSSIAVNIEYGALRAVCALVNVVPYRLAMLIADGAASFAVRVLRFKRARTMDRIRTSFPEKSSAECRRIAVD